MLDAINRLTLSGHDFLAVGQGYWIGFLACIGCFLMTSYFAAGVRTNARLFTVMALFAGVWVAAASIYDQPPWFKDTAPKAPKDFRLHDNAAAIASFIMVFAGAMLAREGKLEHWFFNSQQLQIVALSLLGALVIPPHLPEHFAIPPDRLEVGLAGVLALAGFLSLAVGARAVAKTAREESNRNPTADPPYRAIWFLLAILAVYAGLSILRNAELIALPRRPMSDFLLVCFAVAKILLTPTFCYIVLWLHELRRKEELRTGAKVSP